MRFKHKFYLCIFLLFFSCVPYEEAEIIPYEKDEILTPESILDENGRPAGWGEDSHGKNAPANYGLLFDHNKVLRLDIVIAPSDWQVMIDDMEEKFGRFGALLDPGSSFQFNPQEPYNFSGDQNPVYVPCDLVFEGKTWHHVGMRFKGNSTLRSSWRSGSYKLPIRLTFDKFEDEFPEIKNQRFYGFKKIGLASAALDNSLVREKVTNEIFRAAGVPVARDAFCTVYIDHGEGRKYFGLYTLQELPDKPMLKSIFMEKDGNLYKPDGNGASFHKWNQASFDKETNEDEADFSDVRELYEVLQSNRNDEAAFMARLEKIFDVDGFLRFLAVNQVICNWDTYGRLPHNYYLYHDPGIAKLHWIPFDFNFSLSVIGYKPVLSLELNPMEVNEKWPLIRYLLDIDDYHAGYVYYVRKTIDEIFNPQHMQTIFADVYDLIRPYVQEEALPHSNLSNIKDFEMAFKTLDIHVKNRYRAAQEFVEKYKHELK